MRLRDTQAVQDRPRLPEALDPFGTSSAAQRPIASPHAPDCLGRVHVGPRPAFRSTCTEPDRSRTIIRKMAASSAASLVGVLFAAALAATAAARGSTGPRPRPVARPPSSPPPPRAPPPITRTARTRRETRPAYRRGRRAHLHARASRAADLGPCDPLDPSFCSYPYPNNFFAVADASTATGVRINLAAASMPVDVLGADFDPAEWNTLDGFSASAPALTFFGDDVDLDNVPHHWVRPCTPRRSQRANLRRSAC